MARTALILAAVLLVSAGSFALTRVMPPPRFAALPSNDPRAIRRRELQRRPARERRVASLQRGLPDLALQFVLVGGIAWGGRRLLRLRLKES